MRTLRTLSDKKLLQLEERLRERLEKARYRPSVAKLEKKLWRCMNERLRRIGL